jgi:hypothetical protein
MAPTTDVLTDTLADALDRLSRPATTVLNEHPNTDGVCLACGGESWPCQRAELAEHNLDGAVCSSGVLGGAVVRNPAPATGGPSSSATRPATCTPTPQQAPGRRRKSVRGSLDATNATSLALHEPERNNYAVKLHQGTRPVGADRAPEPSEDSP